MSRSTPRRGGTSRRELMLGAGAALLASGTGPASADAPPAPPAPPSSIRPAPRPSTQPTTSTQPAALTREDLAAADRVLGHGYSPDEHGQMLGIVSGRRQRYVELRAIALDPNTEPAMRFDPRLPGTKLPTGSGELKGSTHSVEPAKDDLPFATIGQLAALLRSRKLTSTELTKLYLARLKQFDPRLKCVVHLTEARALREAARADEEIAAGNHRGPLHGIPYGVKDLLATAGAPTTWGAGPFRQRVFDYDATVVERLARAGAVLVAKLSLGELAMGDVWFGGRTRNPWNPDEGSGGSSAGPAAAVAAGLVAFAIGSETLGSIAVPCAATGVTGLRPTYGRVSRFGAMPLCRSMDKLGPMARCVEDCAAVLHAVHGADGRDVTAAAGVPFGWDAAAPLPALRVGFDEVAFDALGEPVRVKVRPVFEAALKTIRDLVGGDLVPVRLPPTTDYAGVAAMTIAAEAACNFTELVHSPVIDELAQQGEGSWPNIFRAGSMIPAADYLRGQQLRTKLQHEMAAVLSGVDVLVTIPFVGPQSAYTNLTGHPSVITRCGSHDGRPKSIEFVGQLYQEEPLLQFARAFEKATGPQGGWPRL